MQRLVSLAPSATSIVQALGAGDRLVGVTAHCEADDLPVVGGWLNPDFERLEARDPDLVLTVDALQRELHEAIADQEYRTFHHEPATLDDVLAGFEAIGAAIGEPDAGRTLASEARTRFEAVRTATPDSADSRPVVYCEEWPDPPMAAGNWVPEAVDVAGGRYPFVEPGARSTETDRETVTAADPDHVVIHHCGRGERATPDTVERWGLDSAVHVFDDDLLNQPGPRLIDGIERLAERLHGLDSPASPLKLSP